MPKYVCGMNSFDPNKSTGGVTLLPDRIGTVCEDGSIAIMGVHTQSTARVVETQIIVHVINTQTTAHVAGATPTATSMTVNNFTVLLMVAIGCIVVFTAVILVFIVYLIRR